MNRLKLLAAAALLAVPLINACGDPIPPTPVGSIAGQVVIEGEQQAGVTVKLNTGATTATTSGGSFSFEKLEAGTYTITISGYAEDGSFDKTDQSATIATDGQKVTVDFTGSWIRTSSIMGEVTVEGTGLAGVIVKLTGMSEDETTTSATGAYSFTALRAGVHTVEISGFDAEDIGFSATTSVADVAVGETGELDFQATYLRASAVTGLVSVEGKGISATVSLQGVDRNLEVGTNSGGHFNFTSLRKGDYTLAISGYETDEYEFDVTSQTITVAYGETADAPFEGIALRTATISGAVTIEGVGLEGVTVSLAGGRGANLSMVTNATGQWSFTRLHAGDYTIAISGYETDEYGFDETSATVTVALKETGTADFDGIKLRTAAISGQVSVEGDPLAGVTITVSGKGEEYTRTTDATGNYAVDRLHAGDYTITISGFDTDEHDFDPTVKSVSVGLRETADIGFSGIMLRTVEMIGTVTTDGDPLAGVIVTISGGRADETETAVTDEEGTYSLDRLHAGDYTVAVSNFDTDEYEFDPATKSVKVALREKADVSFPGIKLRTVEMTGTVDTDGEPLGGVTVTVSGGRADETETAVTDEEGTYSLDRLHAGDYTVTISGFDTDEYEFDPATRSVKVALREKADVSFPGIKLRTVEIFGTVETRDGPLPDVTVTVSGGRAEETKTATTDTKGEYSLDRLHAGDYTVAISGYPEEEFEFDPDQKSITVALGEEAEVLFDNGVPLRTASISGRVTFEGDDKSGITVTLSGAHDAEMETNATGQYNFPGLPAGDYSVAVTNPDTIEYEYTPESVDVTLMLDSAEIVNFAGRSLRTAVIVGSVTAEDEVIAGAVASLYWVKSLTEILPVRGGTQLTDDEGEFAFDGLLGNTYAVVLTGYDAEYDFPKIPLAGQQFVAWSAYVATDDTAAADFTGTIIRTAKISGEVTADGNPVMDVEVMISDMHADDTIPPHDTTMTDADGMYMFDDLRKGDYTISITNPDPEMYDFRKTESDIEVTVGQEHDDVSFAGSITRKANIEGLVHVEGDPLAGVVVMVEDDDDNTMTDTTGTQGRYNIRGLGAGDYTVSITNPDTVMYAFDTTEFAVDDLGSGERRIVDFGGEYVYDASISGTLFLDEVDKNGSRDDGEPVFEGKSAELAKLTLEDANGDMWSAKADTSGAYAFMGLKAGTYTLMHDSTSDAALAAAGFAFAGDTLGVTVELTGTSEETVDLAYEITKQTINVWALMGRRDTVTATGVTGVAFDVYPNLAAAQQKDSKLKLGSGKTTAKGWAAVTFDRADESDGTVVVNIDGKSTHHKDLVVLDDRIEVNYALTERTTDAMAEPVRLVNTKAAFRWKVMSDTATEVGGYALSGWTASVTGGLATHAKVASKTGGYASVSEDSIPLAKIPMKYTVKLDTAQLADSSGEKWTTSGTVSYTHNGLDLPGGTATTAGTISVRWTTQSLYLGFYREVDGKVGFTKEWSGDDRDDVPLDHRPIGTHLRSGSGAVKWTFRALNSKSGRYEEFKWDHDGNPKTTDTAAAYAAEWDSKKPWLVRFPMIPTNTKLEINLESIGTGKSRYAGPIVVDADNVTSKDVRNMNGVYNTFGTGGGGHPEMWLCGESSGTITPKNARSNEHDGCVTYGYQWANNMVQGQYKAKIRTTGGYTHTLVNAMTATLKGISEKTNDVDSAYSTKTTYRWNNLNDGLYTLKTKKTTKYKLDKAGESYTGNPTSFTTVTDTAGYLDTLFVFYKEGGSGGRPLRAYNRRTHFQVTDRAPKLGTDATLKTLTYKVGTKTKTVPGFKETDKGGKTYDITVGWDVDTIQLAATTNDTYAKASGDIGKKMALKSEGRTVTYSVVGTSEDKKNTATYTISVYRTADRIKVTDTLGNMIDFDTLEVDEYDTMPLVLEVSLWHAPTSTDDIEFTDFTLQFDTGRYGLKDSTYSIDFTTSKRWNVPQEIYIWHPQTENDSANYRKGDHDGEDRTDTAAFVLTAPIDGVTYNDTIRMTFVDKDVKQFVGPTFVQAIQIGRRSQADSTLYGTKVNTTLGTRPTGSVTLTVVPTGGSVNTPTVTVEPDNWDNGGAFLLFGDEGGDDFTVDVTGKGGGYKGIDYPVIDAIHYDSAEYAVVSQILEANVLPGETYRAKVVLWNGHIEDTDDKLVLDDSLVFDSLDLANSCPEGWTCLFDVNEEDDVVGGDGWLRAGSQGGAVNVDMDIVVTLPDTAATGGTHSVTFTGYEDDDNDNGYFQQAAEVPYFIAFSVLKPRKK